MSIKIFGVRSVLSTHRQKLSDSIHACMVESLGMPENKRAHRFISLEPEDVFVPEGRSENYITLEILLMSGRTNDTKHHLIKNLFAKVEQNCGIKPIDVEITIIDSPPENWGFRGITGAEAKLDYKINV